MLLRSFLLTIQQPGTTIWVIALSLLDPFDKTWLELVEKGWTPL